MRAWITVLVLAQTPAYGPGPETFQPVGRFVFRNEAEAIGRKVAATREGLQEPIQIVEVTLEPVPDAPATRGWNVVVVGKVAGGCHIVTVGLTAREGKVYRVTDKRVLPAKAPADCERWFILGASDAPDTAVAARTPLESGDAVPVRTAPPRTPPPRATPTPEDVSDEMPIERDEPDASGDPAASPTPSPARTAVAKATPPGPAASPTRTAFSSSAGATPTPPPRTKRGRPPEKLTREEVVQLATELAAALGWTEIEPKLSDLTAGRWRQDVLGRTKKGKGCGAYKLELTSPEWAMRYQIETARGKSIADCREWYVREGRGELADAWEEGQIDW